MASTLQVIPMRQSSGVPFELKAALNGVTFLLRFVYNVRCKYWTMHVLDASNNPILMGVRCVINYPLLIRSASEDRPVGQLYFDDPTLAGADPGPYDLGGRVRLVFEVPDGQS